MHTLLDALTAGTCHQRQWHLGRRNIDVMLR